MTEFADIYETYFADVELYLRAICRDEALAEELTEQVFFSGIEGASHIPGRLRYPHLAVRHGTQCICVPSAKRKTVTEHRGASNPGFAKNSGRMDRGSGAGHGHPSDFT
mgnify:CR=1 FL=1